MALVCDIDARALGFPRRLVALLFRRFACLGILALAVLIQVAAPQGKAFAESPEATGATPPAVVYVFRAMGGKFVTPEMDKLAEKVEAHGLDVEVFNYTGWIRPAKEAIRRYKSETVKSPIIAVGHSAGGDSAIRFALSLKRANVPVDLVVTLDPTRIANRVPSNVERFINIYSSTHTLGGGDPSPAKDFQGNFASVDLKNYPSIWHLYMPRMAGLQDKMVDKIVEVAALPSAGGAPSIPIEYAPPRDQPLELWDSGVAVVAAAGETAATVAAQFGVPTWVVAEINKVDANSPLPAGQRLIVPRYLGPATPSN